MHNRALPVLSSSREAGRYQAEQAGRGSTEKKPEGGADAAVVRWVEKPVCGGTVNNLELCWTCSFDI